MTYCSKKCCKSCPSLMGLDYSVKTLARAKNPVISQECFLQLIQICEGDAGDTKMVGIAMAAAVKLIEKNTGVSLAPKIVKKTVRCNSCLIPLAVGPVMTQEQIDQYKASEDAEPALVAALEAISCKPLTVEIDGCVIEGCDVDRDVCPPVLDVGRKGCEVKITYVSGFVDYESLECEYPDAILALAMTASDFYDQCYSASEIFARQSALWNSIGWAC